MADCKVCALYMAGPVHHRSGGVTFGGVPLPDLPPSRNTLCLRQPLLWQQLIEVHGPDVVISLDHLTRNTHVIIHWLFPSEPYLENRTFDVWFEGHDKPDRLRPKADKPVVIGERASFSLHVAAHEGEHCGSGVVAFAGTFLTKLAFDPDGV